MPILLLALIVLLGCADQTPERQAPGPAPSTALPTAIATPPSSARTRVWRCPDGFEFITRSTADRAWLYRDAQPLALERTEAASGERFQGPGTLLWVKGEQALLEIGDDRHADCRADAREASWADARLRGVDLRAIGQEPGWILELHAGERLELTLDYGERKLSLRPPEIDTPGTTGRWTVVDQGHQVEIDVEARPCTDAMSGEPSPLTVLLRVDGRRYEGCGRWLGGASAGSRPAG